MTTSRQPRQHRARRIGVGGFPEYFIVEHHLGIGCEHRQRRKLAFEHATPANRSLGTGDALDIVQRRLAVAGFLEHVAMPSGGIAQLDDRESDADLPQQFLATRAS